jgi:universal stress protein A
VRRFQRILVASDLSRASRGAFKTAMLFAKATGGELTVLHVVVPLQPPVPARFMPPGVLQRIDADTTRWAEAQMTRLAAAARKSGARIKTVVLHGDPAREILRAVRSYRIDLLVVGTHARRGVARMILGSVAATVLMKAPCPVVTVRSATK